MRIFQLFRYYFTKFFSKNKLLKIPVLNFQMWIDSKVDGISLALAKYGKRELDMLWLVKKFLGKKMNALDLGGNIGYYSIIMSKIIGNEGRLYVVEPDPRNTLLLKKNLIEYKNTKFYECAIGNQDSEVEFNITEKSNLNTFADFETINKVETKKVKMYKLETFINKIIKDEINFIRMDIEGFEYELLNEAFSFLTNYNKPITILFETHPNYYSDKRNMGNLMDKYLKTNFKLEYLVSAGNVQNLIKTKFNLVSDFDIKSDNYLRSFYKSPKNNETINKLIMHNPKLIRYILLTNRV